MEDLDKFTLDSLDRYFTVLEHVGYTSLTDTNKLLLLQFLQEFLLEYKYYITESDYNVIELIVQCLSGTTCLIPYRKYLQISEPLTNYIYNIPIRITEETDIRNTEDGNLRLVNL